LHVIPAAATQFCSLTKILKAGKVLQSRKWCTAHSPEAQQQLSNNFTTDRLAKGGKDKKYQYAVEHSAQSMT